MIIKFQSEKTQDFKRKIILIDKQELIKVNQSSNKQEQSTQGLKLAFAPF